MMNMNMENMFNGMFGKIESGKCRLSMSGKVAILTSSGYKTYDVKKRKLTNCNNFVLNVSDEMFFVVPTNRVQVGDIILVNKRPCCVISATKDEITVLNYENSTKETVIPERHIFMGKSYFYGKIFCPMGGMFNGKNAGNKVMKFYMMNEMMKGMGGQMGMNTPGKGGMSDMMQMMWFSNIMGNAGEMFGDMFDCFDMDEDEDEEDEDREVVRKNRRRKKKNTKAKPVVDVEEEEEEDEDEDEEFEEENDDENEEGDEE